MRSSSSRRTCTCTSSSARRSENTRVRERRRRYSSGVAAPHQKLATFADLAALGEETRAEIIHGVISEKAAPTFDHSHTQRAAGGALGRRFSRGPGGRWPGGWWIGTETHVEYAAHEVCCHDVVGWRRDRVPAPPAGWPVAIRPDWVCEIVSPKHEKREVVDKLRILHRGEVPHYWILDPQTRILRVHRYSPAGYIVVVTAGADETVRAEPFDAVETKVAVLFGDEDDEE
jgi:Uma2 family endonuclease